MNRVELLNKIVNSNSFEEASRLYAELGEVVASDNDDTQISVKPKVTEYYQILEKKDLIYYYLGSRVEHIAILIMGYLAMLMSYKVNSVWLNVAFSTCVFYVTIKFVVGLAIVLCDGLRKEVSGIQFFNQFYAVPYIEYYNDYAIKYADNMGVDEICHSLFVLNAMIELTDIKNNNKQYKNLTELFDIISKEETLSEQYRMSVAKVWYMRDILES